MIELSIPKTDFADLLVLPRIRELLLYSTEHESTPPRVERERRDVIEKARNGDRDSFEYLASQHLSFISREIAKVCPANSIEDVAQEVLIRLYQSLPNYEESGSFSWWLRKIISRACLDFWRSRRRHERICREYADNLMADDKHTTGGDAALLADLDAFLIELSADDRLVFTLAFLDDLPHREVADLLGITLTATKVRCFRLKQKVRRWFAV